MSKPKRGETTYSEKIPGADGNYKWAVRFDLTGGYLGISQYNDDADRVLLSPYQIKELLAWLKSVGEPK